jgi:hypothetical protein
MMSDPSLSDQDIHPDQSVVASQQTQPLTQQNVQGSALLDANAAGTPQPEGEPISNPIATNFSTAEADTAKTAGVSGEMGAFEQEHPAEQGAVNLHNNPDIPGDRESPQSELPDADPMTLPIDSDTNLPD